MKKHTLHFLAIWSMLLIGNYSKAQVSSYTFAQAAGTYTAITGGTVLGTTTNDDDNFNAINIGFTFNYNCNNYTQISVNTNGFIAMGATVFSSYSAIGSGTNSNVISANNQDLQGQATSEIMYKTTGVVGSRIMTIQWKNYRHYTSASDNYNFQILLYETTNVIEIIYGAFTQDATNRTVQVGIDGTTNADFNIRSVISGTTTWATSTAGATNGTTCDLRTALKPATNQRYRWTPLPVCSGTPAAGTASPAPASVCIGSTSTITLTGYTAGCGISYQWQSAPAIGGPYSNIVGATSTSYVATINAVTYFRCITTCSNGGASNTSSIATVTLTGAPPYAALPYTQDFESWISTCSGTTNVPSANWGGGSCYWRK